MSEDEEPVVIYITDEASELWAGEGVQSEAYLAWVQKIMREGRYE